MKTMSVPRHEKWFLRVGFTAFIPFSGAHEHVLQAREYPNMFPEYNSTQNPAVKRNLFQSNNRIDYNDYLDLNSR